MDINEQHRMIARLTFVCGTLALLCFTKEVNAAPVDEVCSSYADTPAGNLAGRRCRAFVGRRVERWIRIIPLRGEVDYDRLCTPGRGGPNAVSTPEYLDCLSYAVRTVILVRGLK